jgi:hypothetical protein
VYPAILGQSDGDQGGGKFRVRVSPRLPSTGCAVAGRPPLIPFESTTGAPLSPSAVVTDHSLLELDRELDALLDQIQDEIEELGEASAEAMERFQLFCQGMDVKIDAPDPILPSPQDTVVRYHAVPRRRRTAWLRNHAGRFLSFIPRSTGRAGKLPDPCTN